MMPRFADPTTWKQAELLMQPAFIRVIDNIRKQLEQSTWKGTYEDVQLWSEEATEETRARVLQLQEELRLAPSDRAAEIQEQLSQLPYPYPGYLLHLQRQDQQVSIDLWKLCYQICFNNYDPSIEGSGQEAVAIDLSLIDEETGEVDWQELDNKAKQLIERIFNYLPPVH